MKNNNKKQIQRVINVEGYMSFGQLMNGLHTADFETFETVEVTPYIARCKVQVIRNGNVYMTELPRRIRNKPLFRQDNSSLSLGQNGKYYFVFALPESELAALPDTLVREAHEAADKVRREFGEVSGE